MTGKVTRLRISAASFKGINDDIPNKRFRMKGLADYVHSLGLKIGLYSSLVHGPANLKYLVVMVLEARCQELC